MENNESTAKQLVTRVILVLIGVVYVYSFFLPAIDYYGPTYGYELILSPLVLLAIVPNTLVIITFCRYKKFSLTSKILLLIVVVFSSGFYCLIGISDPYPMIDSLLRGYWFWFFSCFGIMLISLIESKKA